MFKNNLQNTNLSGKSLDNDEKERILDILNNIGFYKMTLTKVSKSARLKDAIKYLPKNKEFKILQQQ